MVARQVVLLLTLIVLLFEVDLLDLRTADGRARRMVGIVVLPLLAVFAMVVYRRWHQFR